MLPIERAVPGENSAHGANRGHGLALSDERLVNRLRPIFAEEALVLELAPDPQHALLDPDRGAIHRCMPTRAMITPVNSVEPLGCGASQPVLHHTHTDPKAARDSLLPTASTHGGDHLPTLALPRRFLAIEYPQREESFSPSNEESFFTRSY